MIKFGRTLGFLLFTYMILHSIIISSKELKTKNIWEKIMAIDKTKLDFTGMKKKGEGKVSLKDRDVIEIYRTYMEVKQDPDLSDYNDSSVFELVRQLAPYAGVSTIGRICRGDVERYNKVLMKAGIYPGKYESNRRKNYSQEKPIESVHIVLTGPEVKNIKAMLELMLEEVRLNAKYQK